MSRYQVCTPSLPVLLILRLMDKKFHFNFDVVACQDSCESEMSTSGICYL